MPVSHDQYIARRRILRIEIAAHHFRVESLSNLLNQLVEPLGNLLGRSVRHRHISQRDSPTPARPDQYSLSARASIPPDIPLPLPLLLPLLPNLLARHALVLSVIPLGNLLRDGDVEHLALALRALDQQLSLRRLALVAYTRQFLRVGIQEQAERRAGAGSGRDVDVCELSWRNQTVRADKRPAGGADARDAVAGEGDVGGAGVAAVERPFRLAMADDEDSRRGRGHGSLRDLATDAIHKSQNQEIDVAGKGQSRLSLLYHGRITMLIYVSARKVCRESYVIVAEHAPETPKHRTTLFNGTQGFVHQMDPRKTT